MAGFADMSRLLVLAMVLATCTAQAPIAAQEPLVSSPDCVYTPPVTTKDSCPTILAVNSNRTSFGSDSLRFKTKFGFKGKLNTGITEATLVIGPLPDSLTVEELRLTCQRRRDCIAVPPCVTPDNKVVATVKMARAMELRVLFPSKVNDIYVTGELSTSCGETLLLEWLKGNPDKPINPSILGPEPAAAPVGINEPEAASPVQGESPSAPAPDARA